MVINKKFGNGVLNATPAFQAVMNAPCATATIYCEVPAGTYRLDTSPVPGVGKVIWHLDSGAVFTGPGTLPFFAPTKYQGSHKGTGYTGTVVGGAVERVVSKLCPGDSISMLSTENYGGSTIYPSDAVLLHAKATNSDAAPRTWTQNNNIVKISAAPNNYSCGLEISVQNQTTEVTDPNSATGSLQGLFVSYIDTGAGNNYASAAVVIAGTGASASSGFKTGLWIDNITTGGNGITLKNSGSNAMDSGIDTRGVTGAFGTGAITLGNNHKITGKNAAGSTKTLVNLDSSDYLQVGDSSIPIVLNGNGLLMPNLPTATTAGAVVKYAIVAIAGVNYKIPLYAM
jgi:hypothetical protein